MSNETIGYQNEKGEVIDPPRLTRDRDVWLKETVTLLSEASVEMVQLMAQRPQECGPFLRVFSLITHLAADTRAMLQQGKPPIVPPVADNAMKSDNDPMENRIKSLEADMRDARDRLVGVEVKLDSVEKKVDLLPSKDFVVSEVSRSATKIITWVVIAVGAAQLIPSLVVPLLRHYGF